MKNLESYPRLTLRVSKEPLSPRRLNGNGNGNGSHRYFVRCDEMPGCCAHGSTIGDALDYFEEMAALWSSWFESTPSSG